MTTEKKRTRTTYGLIIAVVVAIALLLGAAVVLFPNEPGPPAKDFTFIRGDGLRAIGEDATELTQGYFASAPYTLDEGWYIVRENITLSGTLTINGSVHLILGDDTTLTVTGSGGSAGITLTNTNELSIYAQSTGSSMGVLVANGNGNGAGIGGGGGIGCGTVTINGGKIAAKAAGYGAGIGGGGYGDYDAAGGNGGTVTINGGWITATASTGGGMYGAGIGGGGGGFPSSSGGAVTITGGTVETVTGGRGIGGGIGVMGVGSAGTLSITGGSVNSTLQTAPTGQYLITVTLPGTANTPVTAGGVTGAAYDIKNITTIGEKMYLWLPLTATGIQVTGGNVYSGTFSMAANNFNAVTLTVEVLIDNVNFIKLDGTTDSRDSVKEIAALTDLGPAPYTLNDSGPSGGWYLVRGDINVTSSITVNGNVRLILGDGSALNMSDGITVGPGSSLHTYSQSLDIAIMGKLIAYAHTYCISLSGGSFANTASISATENYSFGVTSSSAAEIINGVSGLIQGGRHGVLLSSGGTVVNSGTIAQTGTSLFDAGILVSAGTANITNNAGGKIQGRTGVELAADGEVNNSGIIQSDVCGIVLGAGGTVDNHGDIIAAATGGYGISVSGGSAAVTNHIGGTIQGGVSGVHYEAGGSVTNSGDILATEFGGYGAIYISGGSSATVTNYGTIEGSLYGIGLYANGTVYNEGMIEGTESDGYGVYLNVGGTVTNSGTIRGDYCVFLAAGGTVTNSGDLISVGTGVSSYGVVGGNTGTSTITNNTGGKIQGRTGIHLYIGGTVTNSGDIISTEAGGNGIRALGGGTSLTNNKVIEGNVTLANYANNVTFAVGSIINGDLAIGTSAASTMNFVGTLNTSLLYTFINGAADIGSATATVSFDTGGLPMSYAGETVTLIDSSAGSMIGAPANDTFSGGGYDYLLLVENNKLIAKIPSYGIAVSETEHSFPDAQLGYAPLTPLPVTVTNTGNMPTGELSITLSGTNASSFILSASSIADIAAGDDSAFTVVPVTGLPQGLYTATVTVGPAAGNTDPITPVSLDVSFVVTAVGGPTEHYITASSDSGSVITPNGVVAVEMNGDMTFVFSAKAGYNVSSVLVDGKPLSKTNVDSGSYTFTNVEADHTIRVRSSAGGGGPVILTIDIVGGDGGVDISIDGGPYQPYDGPVPIPYDCTLGLVIHPKEGYELSEWRIGDDVFTTPEQTINNVRSSLQLELFFIKVDDSGVMCWIIPILLLILLAGILLWFILFYKKRRYDVYIQEFSLITGDDSVRRKRAYTFTAGEGYSGTVSYRIGEDGTWKLLFRNEDGTYTVPKNEVVGDIYLETRP